MDTQKINLLLSSLGEQIISESQAGDVLDLLIRETGKFRDKLKEERGVTLTVADTRIALDGLEKYLKGDDWQQNLTGEQAALLQIWIDRITLFQK
ncbi:MAG TPA: hypothetical protein VHP63_02445 [candidate division Zixibacteria bacterium]|nr:hypothetical protein [candidate division Zixibacteria bacterium]